MKLFHIQDIYMMKSGKLLKMSPKTWAGPEQLAEHERKVKYGLVQSEYLIEDRDEFGNAIFIRPDNVETAVVSIMRVEDTPDFEEPEYDKLQRQWAEQLDLKAHSDQPDPEPSAEIAVVAKVEPITSPAHVQFTQPPRAPRVVMRPGTDPDATQEIDFKVLRSEAQSESLLARIAGQDEPAGEPDRGRKQPRKPTQGNGRGRAHGRRR